MCWFQSPALRGGFPDPPVIPPPPAPPVCFNPLHYGEGFLTFFSRFPHVRHAYGFQSPALRGGFPDDRAQHQHRDHQLEQGHPARRAWDCRTASGARHYDATSIALVPDCRCHYAYHFRPPYPVVCGTRHGAALLSVLPMLLARLLQDARSVHKKGCIA